MKLSILLATYNGEKYLSTQLDSLLSQTYSDFTIYISDDCSKDSTQNIIDEYVTKYPEKIIDVKNKEHFGNAQNNFLSLAEKVDSDLYMFCDQDDKWLPEKVEKTVDAYNSVENKNQPILVHSDLIVVDGDLKEINPSFFDMMQLKKNLTDWRSFAVQNYVTGCTMLVNNVLVDLYKQNKDKINKENILMHDYFFAQIAAFAGQIIFIDEGLMLYRQHGNNSVGAKDVNSVGYAVEKLKKSSKAKSVNVRGQLQVAEVLKFLPKEKLDSTEIQVLQEYSQLIKKTKLQRIKFLVKNKLLKNGLKRKIFQLLTI